MLRCYRIELSEYVTAAMGQSFISLRSVQLGPPVHLNNNKCLPILFFSFFFKDIFLGLFAFITGR